MGGHDSRPDFVGKNGGEVGGGGGGGERGGSGEGGGKEPRSEQAQSG